MSMGAELVLDNKLNECKAPKGVIGPTQPTVSEKKHNVPRML